MVSRFGETAYTDKESWDSEFQSMIDAASFGNEPFDHEEAYRGWECAELPLVLNLGSSAVYESGSQLILLERQGESSLLEVAKGRSLKDLGVDSEILRDALYGEVRRIFQLAERAVRQQQVLDSLICCDNDPDWVVEHAAWYWMEPGWIYGASDSVEALIKDLIGS
jgi:hypothetical protein